MINKKQFKEYSKYYDLLYKEKNYKKEVEFILKIIARYSPIKVKKILSLGCGTAAHDIYLAQNGYDILGVDLSREMLNIAQQKINKNNIKNIKLMHSDIKNFITRKNFDFAMAMFNIIGYQNTNTDMEKTLKNTAKKLKKGALFVFDCWYLPAVIEDKPQNCIKKIKTGNNVIIRETKQILDLQKNILNISFTVKTIKNKKIIHKTEEKHPMRFWSLPELEYFLNNSEFHLVKACPFLHLNEKISPKYWNVSIIAKKI